MRAQGYGVVPAGRWGPARQADTARLRWGCPLRGGKAELRAASPGCPGAGAGGPGHHQLDVTTRLGMPQKTRHTESLSESGGSGFLTHGESFYELFDFLRGKYNLRNKTYFQDGFFSKTLCISFCY